MVLFSKATCAKFQSKLFKLNDCWNKGILAYSYKERRFLVLLMTVRTFVFFFFTNRLRKLYKLYYLPSDVVLAGTLIKLHQKPVDDWAQSTNPPTNLINTEKIEYWAQC